MAEVTLLHNPQCSKSRQTLALLEERGIEPHIVRYLETPPTTEELADILERLGLEARDVIRRGELDYAELGLDDPALSDEALLAAMASHPRLIQRPIVLTSKGARIGRPPEAVLEVLSK